MKNFFYAAAFALVSASAAAQDVGVNVTVGQPGFYGQVIIGNAPPPQIISPQPVIVTPAPAPQAPIYLRVPPDHQKHWRRYCHRYNACGRPVYFVQDRWYNNVYVPHYRRHEREYRSHRGEWRQERREQRRQDSRMERREDRRQDRRRDRRMERREERRQDRRMDRREQRREEVRSNQRSRRDESRGRGGRDR